jgi:hypothetical protein
MPVINELVYRDLAGNELHVARYIVYAATWGRSSVLKYGIITRRTFAPPCNYRAEPNTPKIGVITADRCSWKDPEVWEVQKNGQEQVLGYLDRMLAIDSNQLPTGAKVALCDAYEKWLKSKASVNGGGHGQGNGTAGVR